jgi:hypothetical protein
MRYSQVRSNDQLDKNLFPNFPRINLSIALSPETPEEIEAWLRWYHSLEPIVMTPEEEAAWEADRKMQKEFDIANAAERDRRIEGIFE